MNRSYELWTGPLNRFQFVVYFKPAVNFLMVTVMNFWGEGKKGKGSFLYSAISSPLDRSKRFTLFALPGRSVHSDTNSASPGSILAMLQ